MLQPTPLNRLCLTDLRWSDTLAGRADEVVTLLESLEMDQHDRARIADALILRVAAPADAIGLSELLTASLHAVTEDAVGVRDGVQVSMSIRLDETVSLTDSVGTRRAVILDPDTTDATSTCMMAFPAHDSAGVTDSIQAALAVAVPVDAASFTDTLTGELTAGSVFGRALVGDALLG
ncbi:MAG: hypothetical protein HQL95_02345 [Magnetococcales bacterium]|nr:hypothetical protein [Magnetococcales bacterium]